MHKRSFTLRFDAVEIALWTLAILMLVGVLALTAKGVLLLLLLSRFEAYLERTWERRWSR